MLFRSGLSGIAAGRYLRTHLPAKRFAILEARQAIGGTWDLFRYPGVRSDSDLATFAYAFKPWTQEEAIASGDDILRYIRETAAEHEPAQPAVDLGGKKVRRVHRRGREAGGESGCRGRPRRHERDHHRGVDDDELTAFVSAAPHARPRRSRPSSDRGTSSR